MVKQKKIKNKIRIIIFKQENLNLKSDKHIAWIQNAR